MKVIFRILILFLFIFLTGFFIYQNKEKKDEIINASEKPIEQRPISYVIAKRSTPIQHITYSGIVNAEEELILRSKVAAEIKNISCKVGQTVRKGQILLLLDDFYLKQNYTVAKEAYLKFKTDYKRYKDLSSDQAVTAQQMEELELGLRNAESKMNMAKKRLEDATIVSPISGVVNQVFVKQGMAIGQGVPVVELVNPNILVINSGVWVEDIPFISKVDSAEILAGGNYKSLLAEVSALGVKPNMQGKYPLQLITRKGGDLLPGTIVDIEFSVKSRKSIYLPKDAFLENAVYTIKNNSALMQIVAKGSSVGDLIEVQDGLTEGDSIIVDGNHLLRDGDRVLPQSTFEPAI